MFTQDDLEAAVRAALEAVGDFTADESDELDQLVGNAVVKAGLIRTQRLTVERTDVSDMSTDDVLVQRRNLAREDKASKAREKQRNKYKDVLDARICALAEQATIVPPFRVRGGGTVSLGSRVWARPEPVNGDDDMDEGELEARKAAARAAYVESLKSDPDTATFVKEDANIMSVSSYFKEEVEHGRVKLDGEGKARIGGIVISEDTTVSVRGA